MEVLRDSCEIENGRILSLEYSNCANFTRFLALVLQRN